MKITKYTHSCLLVETFGRVVVFDPGVYSTLDPAALISLDDILITHKHEDHMDIGRIKALRARFPGVRITAPADAKAALEAAGVADVQTKAPDGTRFFDAPHGPIRPFAEADPPEEIGIHYLGILSDPGDSHSFSETMPVLALPVQAPWGSAVDAVRVALAVKPRYIIPIHDWHWRDEARAGMYSLLEQRFRKAGITFMKMADGEPVEIDV